MSTLKVNTLQTNTGSGFNIDSPLESIPSIDVTGGAVFGAGINVTGISTLGNATASTLNVSGVSTFGNTVVGGGTTQLIVTGDARITGILTIGTGSITLDGSNNQLKVGTGVTITTNGIVGITSINSGQLGGSRNVIINGAMVVNQRGFTGSSGATTHNAYTTDRFYIAHNMDGAVSAGQTTMNSTVGGNAYADGFNSALHYRVTTADASLSSSQYAFLSQAIEGFNVQGFKKGTANAQQFTLSFWVRSSLTGTYIVELYDGDNTRQVSKSYTIDTANTWEKKTLTYPADTTGVFDNDNGASLYVVWWLAGGSTYTSGTLNTSWASITDANRAVGQVNFLATAGNNFFLTGVQLEVGPTATEFERRSFGDELELCQRYFCKSSNPDVVAVAGANYATAGMFLSGTANAYAANSAYMPTIEFPVTMRTTPSTITFIPTSLAGTTTGQWAVYNVGILAWAVATMGVQSSTTTGFGAVATGTWSTGAAITYGAWTASAEL